MKNVYETVLPIFGSTKIITMCVRTPHVEDQKKCCQHTWKAKCSQTSQATGIRKKCVQVGAVRNSLKKQSTAQIVNIESPTNRPTRKNDTGHTNHLNLQAAKTLAMKFTVPLGCMWSLYGVLKIGCCGRGRNLALFDFTRHPSRCKNRKCSLSNFTCCSLNFLSPLPSPLFIHNKHKHKLLDFSREYEICELHWYPRIYCISRNKDRVQLSVCVGVSFFSFLFPWNSNNTTGSNCGPLHFHLRVLMRMMSVESKHMVIFT